MIRPQHFAASITSMLPAARIYGHKTVATIPWAMLREWVYRPVSPVNLRIPVLGAIEAVWYA